MQRLAYVLLLALLAPGCATPPPVVKRSPPEDRPEQPDFKPGPDYFWKRGHYAYDASRDDYVWISGSWEKERVNRTFVPGYWERKGDGWTWHEEVWEEKQR